MEEEQVLLLPLHHPPAPHRLQELMDMLYHLLHGVLAITRLRAWTWGNLCTSLSTANQCRCMCWTCPGLNLQGWFPGGFMGMGPQQRWQGHQRPAFTQWYRAGESLSFLGASWTKNRMWSITQKPTPCTLFVLRGNAAPGRIEKMDAQPCDLTRDLTHKAFFPYRGLWEKNIINVRCVTSEIHYSPFCLLQAFKIKHFNYTLIKTFDWMRIWTRVCKCARVCVRVWVCVLLTAVVKENRFLVLPQKEIN